MQVVSRTMTGLEFLSATIGQLIWPVLVVIVVLLLKEPIKQLLASPRLKRVKVGPGGLEAEFNEELQQVERELEGGPPPAIEAPKRVEVAATDFKDEMERLAEVAPRAVVLESFVRLESLLRNSIDTPDHERGPRFLPIRTLGRVAVDQGLLTTREASVLDELAYLRNRVAHEPEEQISQEAAIRYAEAVSEVAVAVNLALGKTHLDGPPL
jgi:hypothetical protein